MELRVTNQSKSLDLCCLFGGEEQTGGLHCIITKIDFSFLPSLLPHLPLPVFPPFPIRDGPELHLVQRNIKGMGSQVEVRPAKFDDLRLCKCRK